MATRNIVPRANGEGSLGTSVKHWGDLYADNGTIAGRNIANDGTMLDTHETEITDLQNQVTTLEHAYAGAKAAATVADMTDHNQIYVYVGSESGYTNGNWYYYNGTAWTSGGVYNATALETDKTLTVSGAAADAKVTGENIFTCGSFIGDLNIAGYITASGSINNIDTSRHRTAFIPCGEGVSITYRGETNHTNISALTCYDCNGDVLATNVNIDANYTNYQTFTTPPKTAFIILSYNDSQNNKYLVFNDAPMSIFTPLLLECNNKNDIFYKLISNYINQNNSSYDESTRTITIGAGGYRFIYYRTTNCIGTIRISYSSSLASASQVMLRASGQDDIILYGKKDYVRNMYFLDIPYETYYGKTIILRFDNRQGSSTMYVSNLNVVNYGTTNREHLAAMAFVSPTGNDNNSGTSRDDAFATISKAISSGAKNILVKEGTYTDGFYMDGLSDVKITIDHYYDTFTVGTDEDNPKIIIDGSVNKLSNGVTIANCVGCSFSNIEVKNCTNSGFSISKSDGLRFDDCITHDIGIGTASHVGGFVITYTNADFYNCLAYNIGVTTTGTGQYHSDGFNIHYTGTTNFINCSAWNCDDDGISHHDACCGMVDGGEWYNCGKGGIATPTHGAKVNISNAYCHDNKYGLYAGNSDAVTNRGNIIVSNCVFKNNVTYDVLVDDYYKVVAINCVYDTVTGANNITPFVAN